MFPVVRSKIAECDAVFIFHSINRKTTVRNNDIHTQTAI